MSLHRINENPEKQEQEPDQLKSKRAAAAGGQKLDQNTKEKLDHLIKRNNSTIL